MLKTIKVPQDIHHKIREQASKEGITILQLIVKIFTKYMTTLCLLLTMVSCSNLKFERPRHNFDHLRKVKKVTVEVVKVKKVVQVKKVRKTKKKVVQVKRVRKIKKKVVLTGSNAPTYFPSDSSDPNYTHLNTNRGGNYYGRNSRAHGMGFINALLIYGKLTR